MPSTLTSWALKAYKTNNPATALTRLKPIGLLNIIEGFKYPFNAGVMYYQKGDYTAAEAHFRQAQSLVPKQYYCQVTLNLVLAIEAQADAAVSAKDYDKAIERYDVLKAIVRNAKCGTSDAENKAGQKMEDASQRGDQKSGDAKKARNGDGDKKSDQSSTHSQQPSQQQEQQLEKSMEQSMRARQQQSQQDASSNKGTNDRKYDAKNW
jgi:tetratricopeptide (TPR) repeat protein